ncbi:MAG: methylaspartate mutase subunit E, partial [Oscillospiraceae bacterium]|nr:methylaspartate mutase subunit E [Oscillospiraceae bacterium]
MELSNKRLEEGAFLAQRNTVLTQWPTGAAVQLDEAIAYQKAIPAAKRFDHKLREAAKAGHTLIQPRAGVPALDKHIELMHHLETAGEADLLPTTIDSYTRLNRYEEAEKGLRESVATGKAML